MLSGQASESAYILSLPEELILQIAGYVDGDSYARQNTLRNLALTHRFFTGPATEVMLQSPIANLDTAHDLIRVLLKNPCQLQSIRKLEIHSRASAHPIPISHATKQACKAQICAYDAGQHNGYEPLWLLDIDQEERMTYIGVLLTLLPQLEHLCLVDAAPGSPLAVFWNYWRNIALSSKQRVTAKDTKCRSAVHFVEVVFAGDVYGKLEIAEYMWKGEGQSTSDRDMAKSILMRWRWK
ncbi:hypothetical protein P280DRAFT_93235 [Massarina eburnea CBS 473.64]|uniref:F-box domain-containing protein n=1 Tax=Massarina eburnea CBS 473.64 TaxID=1395130 RepID=A0A6A6RRS6_9PLEO|nr:hypothetical protein P280DRAFT_93235 [Massarina eburnea CBS 473.64]